MTADLASVRLAVVGTGLIGASVGLAAKRAGVELVTGFDSDPDVLAVARERGAVDVPATSLADAVTGADLVVVATPVAAIPTQVANVLAATDPSSTVTDVGSTKAGICSAMADERRFVGGHPVGGSEAHGPSNASPDMFVGNTWFLTPVAEADIERYGFVEGFVGSLGALAVAIDPLAHDRLVALTSHLPHALANVLVNQLGSVSIEGHDPLATAGGSLRDMTRVAGANASIWVDILLDNAEHIGDVLGEHRQQVEKLEELLRRRDAEALTAWIEEAARNRRRLSAS